jgi:RNA polymerase sigma factor (sigma-70 family)
MDDTVTMHSEDRRLAARAAAGDLAAWHQFVLGYSGLIRSMTRRYYHGRRREEAATLHVDILAWFHREGLARYDGRAALSTWVMTVTRSRCLDALREEFGRIRPPRWLASLPELDQWIYRLYFVEYREIPEILDRLARGGHVLTAKALEERLRNMHGRLDKRVVRRLAWDLQARSVGAMSGRLLEMLDHLAREHAGRSEANRPDVVLFEKRTRALLEEIRECVERLEGPERRVVECRYYRAMTVVGIAREFDMAGPRAVRSLLNRALGAMRRMLAESHPELDPVTPSLGRSANTIRRT